MEKVSEFEKAKQFSAKMAKLKEDQRISNLEKAKQLWQAGKETQAVDLMMGWGSVLSEDDAREYCQSKFGVSTKQKETIKAAPSKQESNLSADEAIAQSKRIQERLRIKYSHAGKKETKAEAVAADKEDDPMKFFKDNADDTGACIAKMRAMGL